MNKQLSIPFYEHALPVTFFAHTASSRKGCIFYFHGGGLVFGTSDDLPGIYRNKFTQAGYDFISLSYPLAPETSLSTILDAAVTSVRYLLEHPQELGYDSMPPYFLFGRSAGAYLALNVAHRLCNCSEFCPGQLQTETAETLTADSAANYPAPAGILSFYGYYTFDIPEFKKANLTYKKLPAIPKQVVDQLTNRGFLTEGPKETRYSIYIYARQNGNWPELLGSKEELTSCSLSEQDLSSLPPGFFTASSSDQDVPFRISKYMASKVPGSIFRPVYYLEHDFDRDIRCKEAREIYDAVIAWMQLHSLPSGK